MQNYIVIRLVPPTAVDGGTFTSYLDGLTINVYDVSYAHAAVGNPVPAALIGSAGFVPPAFPSSGATQIVQHLTPPGFAPPLRSVATAVIEYNGPPSGAEYVTPDLQIEFIRGAATAFVPRVYYDVHIHKSALALLPNPPGSTALQQIFDSEVSAFVTLSPPTNAAATSLVVPADGTPPNFDDLLHAVTAVLNQDPALPVTPAIIGNLSLDQCRNIAYEIVYGPQVPLPAPPEVLEDMYTGLPTGPNTGTYGDSNEQNRLYFEGNLGAYYGPGDATALRLTNYVIALSGAVYGELQSQNAAAALIEFPANPNPANPPTLTTIADAQIILTGTLGLDVPAAYFYALTYDMAPKVSPAQRFSLVTGSSQGQNLSRITDAIDAGWIQLSIAHNPAQAVRVLAALDVPATSTIANWSLGPPPNASAGTMLSDWLSFPSLATWTSYQPGDDDTQFWPGEASGAHSVAFVDMVLFALTQGYVIPIGGSPTLASQIQSNFGFGTAAQIANTTPGDWQSFLDLLPALLGIAPANATEVLPPFTAPGTFTARVAAFIRYIEQFFELQVDPAIVPGVAASMPERYGIPAFDVIAQTISHYLGFAFGIPLVLATLEAAAAAAVPGDAQAQAWAVQAIWTINELFILSQIPGKSASFEFSVMEALFARGFTSREEVLDLPFDDFQQALTGTVAYDFAAIIYANAGAPHAFPSPPPAGFGPINPCCLTDCIPPLYLSPLGPIAYLHEMLKVSERSTCDDPFVPPAPGHTTLQVQIDRRRGPVETLAVTRANLETPIPLIDIVNECLEFMVSTNPISKHGVVYNTSEHVLAGYKLCHDDCCEGVDHNERDDCHQPVPLFAALPEYSTPATPVLANSAVEPAVWDILKADFSNCCLPYDQALDVNRTYLDYFRSCRYEEMRTFRKCITEFVLDPTNQPAHFQTHLWRYPVRIDIAIEYLGLSREEYTTLFEGVWPEPCGPHRDDRDDRADDAHAAKLAPWLLYGFPSEDVGDRRWTDIAVCLPDFLKRTCLTYCDFIELWKCGPVRFRNGGARDGTFPDCEPCCLEEFWLQFPGRPASVALWELDVFIRLWQRLRHVCGAEYSICELADICEVFSFPGPDFIRQLAAFQMLRDQFRLKLTGERPPSGATGADRTYLLALWVGPAATHWHWAVEQLLNGIAHHAECRHTCRRRGPEFVKELISNFDPLSRLAGFDPAVPAESWHAKPTHTLRFAEVLAKIYASDFSVGELLFLFTAQAHLDGEDPFPIQDSDDADDFPLALPEETHDYSLWHLRRKLLHIEVPEEEVHQWSWRRIDSALTHEFGFPAADVLTLGEHFFPHVLEMSGTAVALQARRFTANLAVTTAAMWNTPPEGPFHYDPAATVLWASLPLSDEAVIEQLTRLAALKPPEQQAVEDVYFGPRVMLAEFGLLFSNFGQAEERLIEERDQQTRWHYFQRQFALCHARCRVIAHHLAEHVGAATCQSKPEGAHAAAMLLLKNLYADENFATVGWENDNGTVPAVTWTPPPNGSAFAALLGLVGTGLEGTFKTKGNIAWREVRGPLTAFGDVRDRENCPVPTVIPSMGLALTPQQMKAVTVRNGLAMADASGRWLGGAESFSVTWHGALLVDEEGDYRFHAGAPSREGHEPNAEPPRDRSWHVILKRGQKTWVLLRHQWYGEHDLRTESLPLRRGAYELTVEFIQHSPNYLQSGAEPQPEHTGFEIRYSGPDSVHRFVTIPHDRLFRIVKERTLTVAGLSGASAAFLGGLYTSSLRDVRRTYQRAFKALLFTHRFALSAEPRSGEGSELGYMLAHKVRFAGCSYYRNGAVFTRHRADFDFNFLPVLDHYHSPAGDSRAHPSPKRIQAMFDWWERIFDYDRVRRDVRVDCERHLWLLFAEAAEKQPADPDSLLRHMCADARHWDLNLHFFQDQFSPIYAVTSHDLEDDRWTVRAWHADRWLRRLWRRFTVADIAKARPDLWASDDPAALVAGQVQTGNANLLSFALDGCLENGIPRRYDDIKRLNDGLRERGRNALISYLCGPNGIVHTSTELSELLLLDVRAGCSEKASRVEEAISAVQTFITRSRLRLEPAWKVSPAFAKLWDSRFASYHVWQACKRRELYKENWIDWHELEKAKKSEAFGFLNEELKRVTLTIAEAGGVDYWPDLKPPIHPSLCLLQQRDRAEMELLPAPREGLNLLATPERSARPSWISLAPNGVPQLPGATVGGPPVLPTLAAHHLPFWIECAIRLGATFVRVAAAAYPPASTKFEPRHECHGILNKEHRGEKRDECCVTCCKECGCEHPAYIDEYWFWLVDARYFDPEKQPVYSGNYDGQQNEYYDQNLQESTPWHDVTQLKALLEWPADPMVRLAWCRIHNGEFQQPRRSVWGVPVISGTTPDLTFEGRVVDSLYFAVTNSVTGTAGFRYDMVPDLAVEFADLVVPAAPPPPPPPLPPAGLIAYPYFAYYAPGARLFPWSLFSPAVAVAHALRVHCRFEAGLKWYDRVYDPFDRDNRWARCEKELPRPNNPDDEIAATFESRYDVDVALPPHPREHSCCCDTTKVSCHEARERSILLHYLDTLLEWGDAELRRESPEAFQQASLLFNTMRKIMGPHPTMVKNPAKVHQTVATFDPLPAPVNPRLMMLYDRLDDRVGLVHESMSARRLREGVERNDAQYWGTDPVRDGWRSTLDLCCDANGWCYPPSPYRFMFLIQRAKERAAEVRQLGSELLSAFEKGDAEFLVSLRARHEREIAVLDRKVREDQWRDADWQVQALEKTKASDQASRIYYAQLIANGLNANEQVYVSEINASITSRTAANVLEGIAEGMDTVPDVFVGTVDFVQIPVGTKLAGLFKTLARVSNTIADIAKSSAELDLTEAGWDRRLQDWVHQVQILDIQIEQTELQILGAERRRNQTLRELNIQQRQIEQSTDILDFLRDKFTNHATYLFLQKHVADLYYQTYELALWEARQAEHAFNFERGYTDCKFIDCENWDNLHAGLLAGERLQLELARMEHEYCDRNRREYELTKHISTRMQFPREFLRLKLTGSCEIEIPEWMFDVDYPGQYMRRIKNVTLTIPCVSGPYNEVHCRLTLLRSTTRVVPLLSPPAALCCHCSRSPNAYGVCLHDPRTVREYGATEAITTSNGQTDAGLFELSFHDDLYLPFEFRGAVSRWRIELPHENNYFPIDTLTDLILHLNYTSREGGEGLRSAARESAECELPGEGWCLFDLRHDFPDAWGLLQRESHERGDAHRREPREGGSEERSIILRLSRSLFPFVPGHRELYIETFALLFNRCEHCGCECPGECPCCVDPTPASYEIGFESRHDGKEQRVRCVLSDQWPGFYHGVANARIGPVHGREERSEVRFRFPGDMCCVTRVYVLCRYMLVEKCPARKEPPALRCNPCG
jgi:hypothetical protein